MKYISLIDRLLASGHSFAMYRLPGQAEVRLVLQYGAARPLRADEVEPRGFLLTHTYLSTWASLGI